MKRLLKKRQILIIVNILLIVSLAIGTIAYLFSNHSVENIFELGIVETEVVESSISDEGLRENISIRNSGNVPIYIRASVLLYFENNESEILSNKPIKDTDYNINYSTSSNWILSEDGHYYYKTSVKPNENTEVLIESFKTNKQYENKKIILDVVTQAIQAEPIKAIEEAWKVDVENNEIML